MSKQNSYFDERYRLLLKRIEKKYPNMPVAKSYLRQQLPLTNNNQVYTFPFSEPGTGTTPLPSMLLKVNDTFIANAVGVFLNRNVAAEPGVNELVTYPNPAYFPAVVGPPAFTPADLEVVYNGFMKIQVNQIIMVNAMDTRKFRVVNQAQEGSPATTTKDETSWTDGVSLLEPYLVFNGNDTREITIRIPSFTGIEIESVVAGTTHDLVVMFFGFLIPNGSGLGILPSVLMDED